MLDRMMQQPMAVPLSQDECMALLSTTSIGRIGSTIDAMPVILPVTFSLSRGAIVFRTMPGTKLHDASLNAVVALQADHYASLHDPVGWSVLVQGMTQEVTDPTWLSAVRMLPLGSWATDGTYVALEPAIVSGRQIVL
jgi:nitroimidazol reductase NimA-like FMN-containing flavoprotein (pyridoxamine 5'-phosphate oxidase superfamily)